MTRMSSTFPARLSAFGDIKVLLERFCQTAQLARNDLLRLTLIVEELFTNTIRHGHRQDCDDPVTIELELVSGRVALAYQDCAPPFDPVAASLLTEVETILEHRPVGGLGILLALAMSHEANYSLVDGRNRVELTLARSDDA